MKGLFASIPQKINQQFGKLKTIKTSFSTTPETPIPNVSIPATFGIGVLAGGLGSLVGMGGAFIALPLLTGYLKIPPHLAIGTSMASVVATSIGGSISYLLAEESFEDIINKIKNSDEHHLPAQLGRVHLLTAISLSAASTVTAFIGAKVARLMNPMHLRLGVSGILLLLAPLVIQSDEIKHTKLLAPLEETPDELVPVVDDKDLPKLVIRPMAIGTFTGFFSGLFGVGGGALVVPMLCLFTDLPYQVAIGTSLAAMIPTSISGTIAHMSQGTILKRSALPLGVGCLVGSYIAGNNVDYFSVEFLKYGFVLIISLIGTKSLIQTVKTMQRMKMIK